MNQTSSDLILAPEPGTQSGLLGHVLGFGRLLRVMGVETSPSQMLDLVQALEHVSIADRGDFYWTSRALLVTRRADFLVFDQAFTIFWNARERTRGGGVVDARPKEPQAKPRAKQARLPNSGTTAASVSQAGGKPEATPEPDEGDGEEAGTQVTRIAFYSPGEVNREKDFREMTWEEAQAARRAMARMEWRLGVRRTRRYQRGQRGRLNMRRVLRDNLRYGGDVLDLAWRTHVMHPRPLVVLCDISGSMERYSRMLLHFIHALSHHWTGVDVEAFAFGTRLTRITHHLRHKDVDESLDELGRRVRDWSGGTRIGEAIKAFNYKWARRVLGRGAVVLIISDGWDRGDAQVLAREMDRLQRSSYRVMWLNPLLGTPEYQPSQSGMTAAMPFVDDFLPGGNLASLEELAKTLSSIATNRPARRQNARRAAELKPKGPRYVSRAARSLAAVPENPLVAG